MKTLFIIFLSAISISSFAQYDTVSTIKINDLILRLNTEADVYNNMGVPSQIKEEIDYARDGDTIKVYCYEDSYFEFWDGKLQSFLIKNSSYKFNGVFQVGDSISKIQNYYPTSFQNPLSLGQMSDFDKLNFNFDKCY